MLKALRSGKAKSTLEFAIDSALLAVEIYNKPRTAFRSEAYISLMIIAWTKMLHAYFLKEIGDKFYYKKGKNFITVDGDRKAWELSTCINKIADLKEPVKKNLEFFIKLRNKIEHRYIDRKEIDVKIFGECQSLLYNFETFLMTHFGDKYSINQSLVYSLQFSQIRSAKQMEANKSALSTNFKDIQKFIDDFRGELSLETYNSQEFSIKLIQIPKVCSSSRADIAIEFVSLDSLSDEDKELYEKITVLIKDKKVKVEGSNVGKLKPSNVVDKIRLVLGDKAINTSLHFKYCSIFNIRPSKDHPDPFETNTKYCHYDEAHNDYVYNDEWVNFLIHIIQTGQVNTQKVNELFKSKSVKNPEFYTL